MRKHYSDLATLHHVKVIHLVTAWPLAAPSRVLYEFAVIPAKPAGEWKCV